MGQKTRESTISVQADGENLEVPAGSTVGDLRDERGRDDVVGARRGEDVLDLRDELAEGDEVDLLTFEDPEGRAIYWHTTAHVLAQAVRMYFGDEPVKLGVGPPVDEGFYYDFDLPRTLSEDELDNIENIMRNLIQRDMPLERFEEEPDEARRTLEEQDEEYKVELLEDLEGRPSFYRQDGFTDLCRGPHLASTGEIGAVSLTKLSGAYWKGDQDNADLQRIYGISFPSEDQLEQYEQRIEEAKKRDHRRLGKQLDLFHVEDDVGPGMVIWHPKGSRIREKIEDYWRERHREHGYEPVHTPHLAKEELWEISGHLSHYRENMFPGLEMDEETYRVKPMNCPFHVKVFNNSTRSYRDLPYRLAELGTVYRYEKSGVLHGLLRVRGFTQDDAHVFCTPDQMEDELVGVLDFITEVLSTFGFTEYDVFVSTRPEDYVGEEDRWELTTDSLKSALDRVELPYGIKEGEGAFYGPKIEVGIQDSLNREWQCSTIQVDFNLPRQFDVEYVDEDGEHRRPIMIHRALFGSLERFFGCLIEHYGGAFPAWLAPTPVWILPISPDNRDYARAVADELASRDVRCEIRSPEETLGNRIRRAQEQKIPYTFILGSDEEESGEIEVRRYGDDDSRARDRDEVVEEIARDIEEKTLRDPSGPTG